MILKLTPPPQPVVLRCAVAIFRLPRFRASRHQARRRQMEETSGSDPERTLSGPEREYIKETYNIMLGTFND